MYVHIYWPEKCVCAKYMCISLTVGIRSAALMKQIQLDNERLASSLSELQTELDKREETRVADLKQDFEMTIAATISAEKAQAREEL